MNWFRNFALALPLVLLPGIASAQDNPQTVLFSLAGDGAHYLLQYVADGAGFFKEEGVVIENAAIAPGLAEAAAVAGGSADMSPLGANSLLAPGLADDLVGIAAAYDAFPFALVLSKEAMERAGITKDMSTDDKVKRMKGLRVAISRPGTPTDMTLRVLFLSRGIDPDKEITIQPFGGSADAIFAAFESGQVDGFMWASPQTSLAEQRGLGTIVVDMAQEYANSQSTVLVTSRATLQNKRPMLLKVVRAYVKAMRFAHAHPDEARDIVHKRFADIPDAEFAVAFKQFLAGLPETLVVSPDRIENNRRILAYVTKTPSTVTYDQAFYPDLARQAEAELPPQ